MPAAAVQAAPSAALQHHFAANWRRWRARGGVWRRCVTIPTDEWRTTKLHAACMDLGPKGKGMAARLRPVPLKHRVLDSWGRVALPLRKPARTMSRVLACTGACSRSRGRAQRTAHRDCNAAENMAFFTSLILCYRGERLADLPPGLRAALVRTRGAFRQVRAVLPPSERGVT
jgi:hypothetical protein